MKNCVPGGNCLIQVPIEAGSSSGTTRYQTKNCTISGIFRKIDTYSVPIADRRRSCTVRSTPNSEPTISAITQAASETLIVTQKPDSSQPR